MKLRAASVVVGFLSFVLSLAAQTPSSNSASAQAPPPLIQFSSVANDESSTPLSGVVNITFSLYAAQQGGEPLWTETQNDIPLDPTGHYSVQLGITQPNGVPTALFTTGEAHWLGVQISGQAEQPRVLLLSVPYALKAGDAATIGGLPPSAFVLAAPGSASSTVLAAGSDAGVMGNSALSPNGAITGAGTVGYIPLWDTTSDIISSVIFQSGSGSTAKVGINNATPAATLDVKGTANLRGTTTVLGTLSLPATGAATASAGKNSEPITHVASAYNSSTSTAVNQTFEWQAEPANNDTSTASGTLNLLFGQGTAKPSETGLHIASNGQITFAADQTFPGTGTGNGTVTSVATGAGLTGGPITGAGTLSIATGGVTNAMLANSEVTLNSGTGITAPGAMTLGDTYTVSINASVVPELTTANKFTQSQTFDVNAQVIGDTRVDYNGLNANSYTPAIRFGTGSTGEAIASDRTGSVNQFGIDLYTASTPRLSVTNGGSVGIGTQAPNYALDVRGTGNFSNGVTGVSNTVGANGVYGSNSATSGSGTNGVYGSTSSPAGAGTVGVNFSSGGSGVYGQSNGTASGSTGVYGVGLTGVVGMATSAGGSGGNFAGFTVASGSGLSGSYGVVGMGGNGDPDGFSFGGMGVVGVGGTGAAGFPPNGGDAPGGVFTGGNSENDLMKYGATGDGVDAYPGSGYAGGFFGDVNTTGSYLVNGSAVLEIDHPLDPANKYLAHASVESSEMKNIYDGNVTTDGQGHATVQLPEWFEVLNTDFRYQLTVIGQFAQAIVAREIENNRFEIRTSAPNVKVSWQVTGVRQDAYAKAHPLVVEQEKDARLRGFYAHPELYGAPPEKQIEWARHPQIMKKMQEMRAKQLATIRTPVQPATAQSK
jgi:trimeric autotransporter adhesin